MEWNGQYPSCQPVPDQLRPSLTVMLACELTTWTQMLAFSDTPAGTWEPKRLRTRIFETAGKLITTGKKRILHLAAPGPENVPLQPGIARLRALAAPG